MGLHKLHKKESVRKVMNEDLINRMKKGESLSSFNSLSSWFPPRPLVKKDNDAVVRLYGKKKNLLLNKRQQDFYPAPITYIRKDSKF
ncbi:MAG: hypothetical protein CMP11_05175 [Zetaproteobacteria bacterium]|nr:hypothetical protein [Pseudobdellovibrionaceae bacterium]